MEALKTQHALESPCLSNPNPNPNPNPGMGFLKLYCVLMDRQGNIREIQMTYKNFNNLSRLDIELFKTDKAAALSRANAHLTKAQLDSDATSCEFERLEAGYIIANTDDLIIDTDDVKATAFVQSLLSSMPETFAVQRSKKGFHFFLKLAPGHGFSGKKIIKFKEIKIELMGAGTWVFGGSKLSEYYKTVSSLDVCDIEEMSDVDSSLLMQQLLSLGDIDYKTGAVETKTAFKPYSMPKKQRFIEKIVSEGALTESDFKEFEFLFRYALDGNYNPYSPPAFIGEGARNTTLLKILTDLARCVDCEDVQTNLTFLFIIARDFCDPSYPKSEFDKSFNERRFRSGHFVNFTRADMASATPNPYYSPINIALDLSPDSPTQNPYFLIKTNEYGEEVLQPLGRGDRVLRAEIMNDSFLSKLYLNFNPKTAKSTVAIDSIPTIRIDNRTRPALSPFLPYKTKDRNVDVFDMSSQHYTRRVRNVREAAPITEAEFWNLPIVKMALENLYPSKKSFEFHMAEFFRVFHELTPTNKVFTFLGSGGIGKDTWFDFISYCFIENFAQIYKKSQSDFLKDSWGYADCASMIVLSEAGDNTSDIQTALFSKLNRVVGNQKITIEKKFAAPEARDVCLFSALVSSNNTSLNLQDYNNTRVVVLRCPESRVLRNNKQNQRYFFGDKNLAEVYEECADAFVSFILNNDVFYQKWRDVAISDIDSSANVREANDEIYSQDETIHFINSLAQDLENDRLDTLIEHCQDPDNYAFKTNPRLKRFAFRIYGNFIMKLGADPSMVEKLLNESETLFDGKHDTSTARLYGICNTLRLAFKNMNLSYDNAQTQAILYEKIIKHIASPEGKWRFSKQLMQRYEFFGTHVQETIF